EVAEFLRRIPEASQNHVLLCGMTNMLNSIDHAILRRGRFDHILKVDMPSEEEILSLLDSLLSPLPTEGNLELSALAGRLLDCPISDIAFVVREAGRLAVREEKEAISADLLQRACEGLEPHQVKKNRIGFQPVYDAADMRRS
ncbi:MAG: AAA family ATPase, partial [Blautia sp.]|nr:AAA family ATPase [Blautia sp.]